LAPLDIAPSLDERAAAVAEVAARHAAEVDAAARFPVEAVDAMRQHGLLRASAPIGWGGEGASVAELASVASRIGEACSSAAMIFAMHHSQLLSIARHAAGSPAVGELLRSIAAENMLLASATTEIGIGGDVRTSTCY